MGDAHEAGPESVVDGAGTGAGGSEGVQAEQEPTTEAGA